MGNLDKYFSATTKPPEHPLIRSWKSLLEKPGTTATCELKRLRDGLTYRPAKLWVEFRIKSEPSPKSFFEDWESELNSFLIQSRVRAISSDNEIERFGFSLKEQLEKPEIMFGETFAKAVLISNLKNSGFADQIVVKEKLEKISSYSPDRTGSYDDCAAMIDEIFAECGLSLTKNLKYDRANAEMILAGAIAYYLDERFAITNRKLLGMD